MDQQKNFDKYLINIKNVAFNIGYEAQMVDCFLRRVEQKERAFL